MSRASGVVSVSSTWYVVLASSVGSMSRLVISLLGLALFVTSCGERYVFEMGRNYVPPYNPGGELFDEDEDFAQSYEVYKQRREDVLADAGSGARELRTGGKGASEGPVSGRSGVRKRDVVEKLREYGAVPLDRVEGSGGGMINKEGVDLARVEGARFLNVDLKPGDEALEKSEARTPAPEGGKRMSTPSKKGGLLGAKSTAQSGGASGSPAAGISSSGKVSVSNVNPPAAVGPDAKGLGTVPTVSSKEEKGGSSSAKSTSAGKKAAVKHLEDTKKKLSAAADSTKKRGGDKKIAKGRGTEKSGGSSIEAAPVPVDGVPVAPSSTSNKEEPFAAPLVEPTSKSKKAALPARKSDGGAAKKSAGSARDGLTPVEKSASTKASNKIKPDRIMQLDGGQPTEKTGEEQAKRPTEQTGGDVRSKSGAGAAGGGGKGVVGSDFLDSWRFDDDEYADDYVIQYMD
ncbi:TRP75-related protein [Anaplasma marginale]|uniref:TRP75-related protein n=1 Tax=Anaplasma marginale TaxID=770 RepID=UPI00031412AA|nr:TRP75-related protein [Anaplasma marginale]